MATREDDVTLGLFNDEIFLRPSRLQNTPLPRSSRICPSKGFLRDPEIYVLLC